MDVQGQEWARHDELLAEPICLSVGRWVEL